MTIRELRILPPFAIARLGSADEPQDNFTIVSDPNAPLGYRRIVPQPTLIVDDDSGAITGVRTPEKFEPRTGKHIRPVAPFLEVWARLEGDDHFQQLTTELLKANGLSAEDLAWTVRVANLKAERRTGDAGDRVEATVGPFSDHALHTLDGHSPNFLSADRVLVFGNVRFIRPTAAHPEIRLRFTPAKGLIYGPKLTAEEIKEMREADPSVHNLHIVPDELAVYDKSKGWWKFSIPPGVRNADPSIDKFYNETLPPALFAIIPPGPTWLNNNVAVSRGYLDDACDGTVEVALTLADGTRLSAVGRIVAAPPAVVPDALFVRTLADDLDQAIFGPDVPRTEDEAITRARAEEILRRGFETVRYLNVSVMNGNPVQGRDPLDIDTMPAEEAFDVYRSERPVFAPETVDTLAIMALHQRVYTALRAGAAPWFPVLLRKPEDVGDFTDIGRRKMPALMAGADGNYLALTRRQIDTVARAATRSFAMPEVDITIEADPDPALLVPRNATADESSARSARRAAELHYVAPGNPVSTRPVTSVGNCTPGLEVDFRFVWRRVFTGILLREYDNLVMTAEDPQHADLAMHRLLRVEYPAVEDSNLMRGFSTMTTQIGPNPYNAEQESVVLSIEANPNGVAPLEWSNLLARMLHERTGKTVTCYFTREKADLDNPAWEESKRQTYIQRTFVVRAFFEGDTAMISRELAQPGELTQGLCSPWQNDYRECSCYYWAAARPDFVNVEATPSGRSAGDNWFQKNHDGEYVPDDYVDDRLVLYDDLFNHWEKWLRFAIRGKTEAK
ncbi:MAG: hypothetical protein IPK82_28615 [Polyangiaceae bacterium]|nr:hypothetical protein [Polyangiaceae bacterium]